MFADRAKIYVRSGKGGDGHVSFRREKYVPSGGPDGGDGGHGGDVIFVVDEGLNTLIDFRHIRKYKAGDGEEGGKKNCRGKDGEDIIIKVPAGTVIKEAQSGQVITDMSGDNKRVVLLKGGKGGNGNQHYATSTMQAPKYAQPGQAAQELMSQSHAFGSTFDQSGDIRNNETTGSFQIHHTQIWIQSSEMIVGNLGSGIGYSGQKSGLTHIRESHQSYIGDDL